MQTLVKLLRTETTDTVESLRSKHSDAARKVAQGAGELETLTTTAARLRLDRARLIESRDDDPGIDLHVPLRKVEGELATVQRRIDDLADILRVRQDNADMLAEAVQQAERQAAPRRMQALARAHAQDRDTLRVAMEDLRSLAARILTAESDMQALHHQHGIQATGVLVIEALATTAQSAASDILGKLDWQDAQVQQGDALAGKLAADRQAVDRANAELGYEHYVSPGVDYFTDGWLDETVEQRSQRAAG
jgi:chromosome segregation ATPase